MATLSISLPDEMKVFIEAQVASGAYHNHSEFIRDLIRHYQREQELTRVEQLLLDGLSGGADVPLTEEVWDDIRRQLRKRARARVDMQK